MIQKDEFSDDQLSDLSQRLKDYDYFKSNVVILDEILRIGLLTVGIGVVAGIMNAIVVAGQLDGDFSAIFANWFAAEGSSKVFTYLLKFLAVVSIASLVIGLLALAYAPVHKVQIYRKAHRSYVERGWIARGEKIDVKVEDDNLWIKKPVPVILWSPPLPKRRAQWERDCHLLHEDMRNSQQNMVLTLLLNDRKFHGAISLKDLRSRYERPRGGGGRSLIGFGPLMRVRARSDLALIAPPSSQATTEPQPWDKLVFWLSQKTD